MSVIQPNELRVGNLLQRPEKVRSKLLDGDFIYFMVDAYMIRDCQHYKENWAFEGIPLTPEILEKAGFRILDDAGNWKSPEWNIWCSLETHFMIGELNGEYAYYFSAEDDFYSYYSPKIIYLHQLQNLYFALTGQELTIKL